MKIIAVKNIEPTESIESSFPIWLHYQIMKHTNNFKKHSPLDEEAMKILTNWAYAVEPNLKEMDLVPAYVLAKSWNQQQLAKQYKTNDVVYSWKDGWRMVKLPFSSYSSYYSKTKPEEQIADIEIEKELMEVENEGLVGIYETPHSYLIDNTLPEEGDELIIYSLRDPYNTPTATIEIEFNKKYPNKLYVKEILTNNEMIQDPNSWHKNYLHPQKNYIKEFFNYLKDQGYQFGTIESGSEDIKASKLDEVDMEDQFGVPYELWGIGGGADNYYDSLMECYAAGDAGSYWYKHNAIKAVDNLISYAEERNELDLLQSALEDHHVKVKNKEGKEVTKYKNINDWAFEQWIQTEDSMNWEHPYPGDEPVEEDFMMPADVSTQQPELKIKNLPPAKPILDKNAYEQAKKEYQEALRLHEKERDISSDNFEPYVFQNYVYKQIQTAKENQKLKEKNIKTTKEITKAENMKTKIIKIADKIDEKLPDGEQMALYVLTLKNYLKDNPDIPEEWKDLISKMPSPRQVRQNFSRQELKILYETVEYLWKLITKTEVITEKEIVRAPETLNGNYIMVANGILLKGINTHDIIKRNSSLLCSLLNIGGMTMKEKLTGKPQELVKFIIKNGALRLFITSDKRFYAQCSPETYGSWARDKIRKLDFKKKVVKLIDLKKEYSGWKDGISVIL